MAVDIDEVLEAIGEVGPYQKRIYFLLCLPIIFVGAANLAYVFVAATPQYRCLVGGCDVPNHQEYNASFLNFSIPWNNNTQQFDSCHQYRRKAHSNSSVCLKDYFTKEIEQCELGILFDKTVYESTIITEFNLTCRDSWEANADQAIYFGGMLVGAFIFGVISDIFGRRKTIMVGIVGMAISGITIALIPNVYAFHTMRFLNAMSSSGLFQTAFILGMEFVGPKNRVMFGVIGEYFFALGEILLGLTAWAIRSWRMLQLLISAPVICFIFYYWVVPESVRWLQAKGKHAQVVASLEVVARVNKKTIPLNLLRHQAVDSTLENDDSNDMSVFISRHHNVSVFDIIKSPVMSVRTTFMIVIWITTTMTYYGLSYNAIEIGGGNDANKPYINFLLSALVEFPGYTFSWIGMEYWGRKWSLMASLFLSGGSCIAASYLKGFWSQLSIFLMGKCSITCAFAVTYVFTAEMFPTSVRNTLVGTCSMFARIGGMLAPFSTVLRSVYLPLPMLIFGVLSLLSGFLTLALPETLNTKLPDTITEAINLGKSRFGTSYPPGDRINTEEEEERLLETAEDSEPDQCISP